MKRALWFALKFIALTVPLTWIWVSGGRQVYASYFIPVADGIYELLGVEGVRAVSRERYINYVPFVALVILTPSLSLRRRVVGLVAGAFALFCSHVLINGIAHHWVEGAVRLPVELAIVSDALPFLLWAIVAPEFIRSFPGRG